MDLTPIPTGNDVRVNTFTTGDQRTPSVTALAGGGFVVTWASIGQDGSGYGIYGQRYAADGTPVGSEFLVNTFATADQLYPSVAALADGGFVVTWQSTSQERSWGIYGQRYAADGTAVGSEFRVNPFTLNDHETFPSVAALADGGFVVTWMSDGGQDGSDNDIYGQRYAADGTAVGSEFRVNTFTNSNHDGGSVTALAGGGFVVTWASIGQDGFSGGDGIYGQRYTADGTAAGSEFRVDTITTDSHLFHSVTALAGGGFVVTWTSFGGQNSEGENYGQRYAADGTALGSEFHVNTYTAGNQALPSVTALAGGGFVVTWTSRGQDGSDWGIYGQRYASDGTAVGSEFRINSFTAPQWFLDVAELADGRLVQVWSGFGDTAEVFFRLINVPTSTLNDTAITNEDTPVNVHVLANDGGFEGTPEIISTTNGAHGTVSINNNGTTGNKADDFVVYTPTPDFNGTDSFTYTVTSGGVTETATVSVIASAVQDAFDDSATVSQNTSANPINVLANDFFEGTEQITAVTQGTSGTVAINDNGTAGNTADDFVTYTPNTGFFGNDTFTYTVTSPTGTAETATVSVSVAGNASPVITSDGGGAAASVSIPENSTAVTTVTGTDLDGHTLNYSIIGGADSAFFEIDATGALAFITGPDFETPADAGANNIYDVMVQVSDGHGGLDTQAIAVTVTDVAGATINASNGGQTLNGTGEQDLILGGSGKDALNGGGGDDTLYGGNGKDALNGGAGNNILTGGNASDDFLFGADATGFNRITDFENDHLRLIEGVTVTETVSTSQGIELHLSSGGDIFLSGVHVSDWHLLL